ncbi:MAG: L-arabinose isomerase [Planctomycetaceae bacterium]|nr:L-arabinose isomerase [Planctomycetaceae bacterium]
MELKKLQVWFITGSQHLYGPETLKQVAADSQKIAQGLSQSAGVCVEVVYKPVLTTAEAIRTICLEANAAPDCVGLIAWMHTFSPAKMWIGGLSILAKPFMHLHTQFNRDIPWSSIDMDFMNLNQSAHGGREFGFICTRMRKNRKVVVGHWQEPAVEAQVDAWARAACAWHDAQGGKIARFGDNMRDVAVTEGDKVEAQMRLGYSVNGYGMGELAKRVTAVGDAEADRLAGQYDQQYDLAADIRPGGAKRGALREAARIDLGMRAFLTEGNFKAFTTTFEDLHGLAQLPGLAVQRLMADGYGFGAEGDWKTAALVRAMKVMAAGRRGGTSFMEDYTYHLDPAGMKVLGAHMLEVCPSIAAGKPVLDIRPLSIGGKDDPARLIFNVPAGPAINATVIDMGNRFRMIVNEVDAVAPEHDLPNLPVARALWVPRPSLAVAAGGWILAGGAHHTGFSMALTAEHMEDFADIAGIEFVLIGGGTEIRTLKQELRWNEMYYA